MRTILANYIFLSVVCVVTLGSARSVHAAALPAPAQVHPANGAVSVSASDDSLTWNAVTGATSYRVQLTTESSFTNADSIVADSWVSKTVLPLPGVKTRIFYWRVRAANSTDTSAWSGVWTFDGGTPPSPALVSPLSQALDRPSPLTLIWSSTFAASSHVQLALYRGDFSFSAGDIIADTMLAADSLVVGGLGLGQTYYWRVSSQNVNGVGSWSSVQTFSTSSPPGASLLQPGYAAQMQPAGITCSWLQSGGAVMYELQVSEDPFYNSTPVVDTTLQNTSVALDTLANGVAYYWRVRAESNVGNYWGTWSTSVFYTFPAPPSPVSPSNRALTHAVGLTLRWNDVAGATFYRIQLALDSSFSAISFDSTSSSPIDSLNIDTLAANTRYFWRVRGGSNNNGWGQYSTEWEFSTATLPAGPPTLVSPRDRSTISPLHAVFSWDSTAGASEYLLQLSTDSTFFRILLSDSSISADSLVIDSLDTGTTYFWRVKGGSNTAGWGRFSTTLRFTTTSYILPPPELSAPADSSGNLVTRTVLHWKPVPFAALYQVQISPDSNFTSTATIDTSVVADSIFPGLFIRGFKYYWHVRAGKGTKSWGPYSQRWTFAIEPWTQTASFTVDTTMSFPQYSDVSQFKPADYKLFGLPGHTNQPLIDLLKGIPGKDWEVYSDNGDTADYLVKYDGSGNFVFGLGNAFWLIHNGPLKIDTSLAAAPLDSIGQVKIFLHPGWNIITDPYLVVVPWDTVQALNGNLAGPVWGYDGNFNVSNSLAPFQGYYYFNSNNLNYLLVPYIEPQSAAGKPGRLMQAASVTSGWTVHVTLSTDGMTDRSTWFGASAAVGQGLNSCDVRKPRAFGFEPSISFDHPDWDRNFSRFASEVHPLFADSSEWTFDVEAVPGKSAEIDFSGIAQIPDAFEAFLYDPVSNSWTNIKETTRYNFVPVSQKTSLTLIVGKSGLISNLVNKSRAMTFQLESNYPNPFNPTTVISYQIPSESLVNLEVFNVLGQRVATLVNDQQAPGKHTVEFDGERLASGVYFYRLVAGNHISTRKMVLLK
jgi:Secretion system C-terminal sorting domain